MRLSLEAWLSASVGFKTSDLRVDALFHLPTPAVAKDSLTAKIVIFWLVNFENHLEIIGCYN